MYDSRFRVKVLACKVKGVGLGVEGLRDHRAHRADLGGEAPGVWGLGLTGVPRS